MDNLTKYREAFIKVLNLDEDFDGSKIKRNETPNWDSVGHVALISEIEDRFDIMFEMEDIISFKTFEDGLDALKRNSVEIGE